MTETQLRTILVTGGAGFIGANFVHYLLNRYSDVRVVNLDKLTYAGNPRNVEAVAGDPRYRFIHGDIADAALVDAVVGGGGTDGCVDAIVHFAAESHVDRSIVDPGAFVRTNVEGTRVLLDAARRHGVRRFVQISTDEVYGSLGPTGYFTETSPLDPSSPYSASKAAADLLALAYYRTYGLPVMITRCSNNFGPFQFPEKLIPSFLLKALRDEPLPLYGDGLNVRDWLYVEDHCRGVDLVLRSGRPGEVYNIGGHNEKTNLEIARLLLRALGKPETLIRYVKDRPGHDRRYAIDPSKIERELGWSPAYSFEEALAKTIDWYLAHGERWWTTASGASA